MSCPNPIELSRALVAGIEPALHAHLETCARCRAEIEAHATIADGARHLPIVEPTVDHARTVRAALMTAAHGPAVVAAPARRLWLFGAGAALAVAAVLVVVIRRPASQPVIAYRATIHAHDGAEVIRVGGAPDEIVRLTQGTITVEVSPLGVGERFRVITADGEVEVRGTAFDVRAEADRLAAVHVLHGKVEVRMRGATPRLLAAGERWEVAVVAPVPAIDGLVPEGDVPGATAKSAGPNTRPTAGGSDSTTKSAGSNPESTLAARSAEANTGSKPTTTGATIATKSAASNTGSKPTTSASKSTAITTDASKPIAAPGAPKRPIEILFEQGWAALAAGNPRDAATAFERAATSAPNDPLAEDAWFWHASALARAKQRGAATTALEQFLARYPRSNRAGEASAVLGWLVIAHDLDRAEKLFARAAKDRVPAVRASGEKGLAAVAKQR